MPGLDEVEFPKWAVGVLRQVAVKNYSKADQLCRKRITRGNKDELTVALQAYIASKKAVLSEKDDAIAQFRLLSALGPVKETETLGLLDESFKLLVDSTVDPLSLDQLVEVVKIYNQVYEKAAEAASPNGEVLRMWFDSSIARADYANCLKVASLLTRAYPDQPLFQKWQLTFRNVLGRWPTSSTMPNASSLNMTIAHRLAESLVKTTPDLSDLSASSKALRCLHSLDDAILCLDIYMRSGHFKEACDLIDEMSKSTSIKLLTLDDQHLVDLKLRALSSSGGGRPLLQYLIHLLEHAFPPHLPENEIALSAFNPRADTWVNWKLLVDTAWECRTQDAYLQVFKLIDWVKGLNAPHQSSKNAFMADIFLRALVSLDNEVPDEAKRDIFPVLKDYLEQNLSSLTCYSEIKESIDCLRSKQCLDLSGCMNTITNELHIQSATSIEKQEDENIVISKMYKLHIALVNSYCIDYHLSSTSGCLESRYSCPPPMWSCNPPKPDEEGINESLALAKRFNNLNVAGKTSFGLQNTGHIAYLLYVLAVSVLKYGSDSNELPIARSAAILRVLREKVPTETEFNMALIRTYILLGAIGPAFDVWNQSRVKNVLMDTVGPNFFHRLSTLHPYPIGDKKKKSNDPLHLINEALSAHEFSSRKFPKQIDDALENGDIKLASDKIELQLKLEHSLSYWMFQSEKLRIERLTGAVNPLQGAPKNCPKKLFDNRDDEVFPDFEQKEEPSAEQFLTMWPKPNAQAVKIWATAEEFISILQNSEAKDLSKYYKDFQLYHQSLEDIINSQDASIVYQFTGAEQLYLRVIQGLVSIEISAAEKGWSSKATNDEIEQLTHRLSENKKTVWRSLIPRKAGESRWAWDGRALMTWEFFHTMYIYFDMLKVLALLPKRAIAGRTVGKGIPAIVNLNKVLKQSFEGLQEEAARRLAAIQADKYKKDAVKMLFGEGDMNTRAQGKLMRELGQPSEWWEKFVDSVLASQCSSLRGVASLTLN